MNYIYYKCKEGNFGDKLNVWLWPVFFGETTEQTRNTLFYGIGTILSKSTTLVNENPTSSKIIFGTGVRACYDPLTLDSSWNIKFVRGPLSSMSLGGGIEYITDSAYSIRQLENFSHFQNLPKKYNVSIMPHISSASKLNWPLLCKRLGFHYISPYSEKGVQYTIKEIASSKYLVSEALHGAIVADALRVPWKRLILFSQLAEGEGIMVSEFKWMDWLFSIKMYSTASVCIRIYSSFFINTFIKKISFGFLHVKLFSRTIIQNKLVKQMANLQKSDFYLSSENTLNNIDKKIEKKIRELQVELGRSINTSDSDE